VWIWVYFWVMMTIITFLFIWFLVRLNRFRRVFSWSISWTATSLSIWKVLRFFSCQLLGLESTWFCIFLLFTTSLYLMFLYSIEAIAKLNWFTKEYFRLTFLYDEWKVFYFSVFLIIFIWFISIWR